jgi:hypothetical protein
MFAGFVAGGRSSPRCDFALNAAFPSTREALPKAAFIFICRHHIQYEPAGRQMIEIVDR